MAGLELGLTALQNGIDKMPDDVWHKIPYFCPPEVKEQKRRDSQQQSSRRKSKRSSRPSVSKADAPRRRSSSTSSGSTSNKKNDMTSEESGGSQHPAPTNQPASAASAAAVAPPNIGVDFKDPFKQPAPAPLDGYSDGPAPALIPLSSSSSSSAATPAQPPPPPPKSFAQPYIPHSQARDRALQAPRHSIATFAPMGTPGNQQPYFPPPPRGDDYARSSYDPSRYQPAGDYRDSRGNEEAVGAYYGGDDRYGGRAASADPYPRHGRSSRYDDYSDDERDDRSRHRRSKSKSSRHSERDRDGSHERGGMMGKLHDRFDTTDGALGTSALGAVVGGVIGHKFGKSPLATIAGAAIGGIGVNAWEAHRHHQKDRAHEQRHGARRADSVDAIDGRTRRDLEYYGSRADDDRVARRSSSRFGRDQYDDGSDRGYDSGEDRKHRRRSNSRRRRDDDYDR